MAAQAKAILPTIKLFAVLAVVALLAWALLTFVKDQKALRARLVDEATSRALAEREVVNLQSIANQQAEAARRREAELAAARAAVEALNTHFAAIKADQRRLLTSVQGLQRDLDARPAPEVEDEANALMARLNADLEAVLR